ncbi:MAG: hypothetical protein MJ187_00300 [Alphaproteobacteria bacterium]|nr:hypothetical protein [Alphaproteobacteria bacterium]
MMIKNNNTKQKIFAFIALGGLFASGLMLGMSFHSPEVKRMRMTQNECDVIANKISKAVDFSEFDSLEKWQLIYERNCHGHILSKDTANLTEKSDTRACAQIEVIQLGKLNSSNDENTEPHIINSDIYANLAEYGCPENTGKYRELAETEKEIAAALRNENPEYKTNVRPCAEIERNLSYRLYNPNNARDYLNNADVYSTMAERGCPENAEKYKLNALNQLEIASALMDKHEISSEHNVELIIDTYKKLQMRDAAREVLNKMQKLTEPAIDFILTMEKVINE